MRQSECILLISTTYDNDVAVRHILMAYNRENNVLIKKEMVLVMVLVTASVV